MTATSEDVVLDVDLDKAMPCNRQECEDPAVWRLIAVHLTDGRACASVCYCEHHTRLVARALIRERQPGHHWTCLGHALCVRTEWRSL
ncbi:hypothetical protein [Georgenia wangjunii]|uniref:hypothetical protein n=1 Tax=Georgenia wangjunii TaxID=3117730 RepID=UPI002F263F41